MIFKQADDHSNDLSVLEEVSAHPDASPSVKKRIVSEIKRIKAGAQGEEAAAYEIDRLFGRSENYAVIHDLRVQVNGQVAQIDHLVINRFLDIFLCETKNFAEGLACNEHGEWVGFRGSRPFGIASPIHQGVRHSDILQDLLSEEHSWHPRRMGRPIKARVNPFVLVANSARITRPPSGTVSGIENVVKIEAFGARRKEYAEQASGLGTLVKMVSVGTLKAFSEGLAACHTPFSPDWYERFGLKAPVVMDPSLYDDQKRHPKRLDESEPEPATELKPKKKLICTACGTSVPFVVARFCWRNTKRFGGDAFCRECQLAV